MQVMRRADGHPIVLRVVAAARAEVEMVIVKVLPSAATGNGTAPAVARKDRVPVAWLRFPFGAHMPEQPLHPAPGGLTRRCECHDCVPKERNHRRGSAKRDRGIDPLAVHVRTHLRVDRHRRAAI